MPHALTIVWFRQDLRIADNPALRAAAKVGSVLPVYIWAPEEEGNWAPGSASRWWLHRSLESLSGDLSQFGSRLTLCHGKSLLCLMELVKASGATAVYWNRRYEPAIVQRDQGIKQALQDRGLDVKSFNSSLLFEPWEIENKQGRPFQVFTPFWRKCLSQNSDLDPLPAPAALSRPVEWPASASLSDWQLQPEIEWDKGLRKTWQVGAAAGEQQLQHFVATSAAAYEDRRNELALDGTSWLSPHLHFGEISPRQVWAEVRAAVAADPSAQAGADCFLSEIGWREFGYHLLHHFPSSTTRALRAPFRQFPWREEQENLERWQRGQTGYPVVDAAMRQLWQTGWMHNRARMIVASFLCKHLLIPWQRGAEWFWETLVDADLASNTLGWQWTAGCGADAAPFFRIFNPITQGDKFDPHGEYVRRWVPELADLPTKWLFRPWAASDEVRNVASVKLGCNYPCPIVDHAIARQAALDAYEAMRVRNELKGNSS